MITSNTMPAATAKPILTPREDLRGMPTGISARLQPVPCGTVSFGSLIIAVCWPAWTTFRFIWPESIVGDAELPESYIHSALVRDVVDESDLAVMPVVRFYHLYLVAHFQATVRTMITTRRWLSHRGIRPWVATHSWPRTPDNLQFRSSECMGAGGCQPGVVLEQHHYDVVAIVVVGDLADDAHHTVEFIVTVYDLHPIADLPAVVTTTPIRDLDLLVLA